MLYSVFEFYRRMKIAAIVKVQNCRGTSAHVVSTCRAETHVSTFVLFFGEDATCSVS